VRQTHGAPLAQSIIFADAEERGLILFSLAPVGLLYEAFVGYSFTLHAPFVPRRQNQSKVIKKKTRKQKRHAIWVGNHLLYTPGDSNLNPVKIDGQHPSRHSH